MFKALHAGYESDDVLDEDTYVADLPPLSFGLSVPAQVDRLDSVALGRQSPGVLCISAGVLSEAVNQAHDGFRSGGRKPPLLINRDAVTAYDSAI